MPVKNKLHYLLIQHLRISKKEALALLEKGFVFVNEVAQTANGFFEKTDTIRYENIILQTGKKIFSIAFYKPRGIETTLNETIESNLKSILPFEEHLFPVGRLDKASEGLLLLTNDGQLYRSLNHYGTVVEKEYIVTVDKILTTDFVEKMSSGVRIMGQVTLPCRVELVDDFTFNIILIQGLNRQIRRMCYQLNYEVTELKRVRIGSVELGDLDVGAYRVLEDIDC
jgi:23S rRNA pseudouridine2604 synthase